MPTPIKKMKRDKKNRKITPCMPGKKPIQIIKQIEKKTEIEIERKKKEEEER